MAQNVIWITLFLVFIFVSDGFAVVGPGDGTSFSGRRRELPESCPINCFCSGQDTRCDHWPSSQGIVSYSKFDLPRRTRNLSFKFLPNLRIDKSSIFEQFEELQWLQLHNGQLVELPNFPELQTLSFLDLSFNKIRRLRSQAFKNTPHIVYLNISANELNHLSSNALEGLNDLQQLDLSKNPSILQLPSDFFSYSKNLRLLDISATNIDIFHQEWTADMQELHTLILSYNNIVSLPQIHLPNLQVLDLSYNPLIMVPHFSGFSSIKKLYLSHTLISYLKNSETEGCNSLKILDLRDTNLTNLNEGVLSKCNNLEELILSNNQYLWRIEHGALADLKSLRVLRLDNCPNLYDVEEEALNGLNNLKELHFQKSGIKVLPLSLAKLQNLTLLNIEETSLFCDCYAYWLPDFLILSRSKTEWRGIDMINCTDKITRTPEAIANNIDKLHCTEVKSYTESNQWVLTHWGHSATLECNVTGNPKPKIIWQTNDLNLHVYNKSMDLHPWMGHQISEALTVAKTEDGKYQVLKSGQLLIKSVNRDDIGRYRCFAFNPVSNSSVVTFLGLDDAAFRALILESILFGFTCATFFFLATLLVQFIKYSMNRLGYECCCCKDRLSPQAKQIRQLIESVETYKSAQLEKLRENYACQVTCIKESCYLQMEKLRESYAHQSKNLKDLCDYSTQQISGARDQYLDQVNKVRDYSLGQMNRVRENYVFQRNRVRKFSGHQLLRLRETYKYQQKTLNKLLETLPDLYIQNCRTGSCQRRDSIIFDNLEGLDVYYKVDFLDNQSCASDYYTPNSTLTSVHRKSGKSNHSRDQSSTSGGTEYLETHSHLTRQESSESEKSKENLKQHTRSCSMGTPQSLLQRLESSRNHKRSISISSQPSPNLLHSKRQLAEEDIDYISQASTSNSKETPLYTPLACTPVHYPQHMLTKADVSKISDNTNNEIPENSLSNDDREDDRSESTANLNDEVQNKTNCDSVSDKEKNCDSKVRKKNETPTYEMSL